jgi:hypothetical protein
VSHSLAVQFLNVLNGWHIRVSIFNMHDWIFTSKGPVFFPGKQRTHIFSPETPQRIQISRMWCEEIIMGTYNIIYLEKHILARILLHLKLNVSNPKKGHTSCHRIGHAHLLTSGDVFEFSRTDMGKPPKIPLQFSV